jgi:hypothetical protein
VGPEIVLLATTLALTGRSEISQALDAKYQVGPKVEQYFKQRTPPKLWETMAFVGPVAQMLAERRVILRVDF